MTPRQVYPKRDANQKDIVEALVKIGCQVFDTSPVGNGLPDLIVLYRGELVFVEVKMPGEKLNPKEKAWWEAYKGPGYVVNSPEMAVYSIQNYMENDDD